ncbi:MAG: hypothetical protein ABI360_10045 [Allobranchiibius sp.]
MTAPAVGLVGQPDLVQQLPCPVDSVLAVQMPLMADLSAVGGDQGGVAQVLAQGASREGVGQ